MSIEASDYTGRSILTRIQEQIIGAAPEICQGCSSVDFISLNFAERVVKAAITLELAQEQVADDISLKCQFGRIAFDGCSSGYNCSYGRRSSSPSEYHQ